MKISILFKCDHAAHICDKAQYQECSRWERSLMRLHHMMCRICREHSALNSKLTSVISNTFEHRLPPDQKDRIKARIDRELSRKT